jgi:hypothetical protein
VPTKNPAACFLEGGDREDTSVVVVDSPQWGVIVSRRSTLRDPSLLVSYSAGYNQFQHAGRKRRKIFIPASRMLSKGTIVQPLASQIFQRAAAIRLVLCGRVTPASEVELSSYCCLPAERERLIRLEMGIHECHMQLFWGGKKRNSCLL